MDPITRKRWEELKQEGEFRKCAEDWFHFVSNHVITQDEHDFANPYKRFPVDRLPYIQLCGETYLSTTERLAVFVKSRQIMLTWLFCALDLWEIMFHPGRLNFITAQKEQEADKILGRSFGIYERLPTWLQERIPVKSSYCELKVPSNGSLFWALADGSDQLRSHTASRWRCEEAMTQAKLQQSLAAAIPTIKGGGRIAIVSSAGPNYFRNIVFDQMAVGDPPMPTRFPSPMQGVKVWKNARNKYYCVEVHYTADPAKRSQEAIDHLREGIEEYQFQQEYEINWSSKAGLPAIPIFMSRYNQIVIPPFPIPESWPRFNASDYGTANPYCALFFAIDQDRNLYIYWEYYAPGPLGVHLATIKSQPDFERLEIYQLDRSCWAATQQATSTSVEGQTLHSMRSVKDLHEDLGVYPSPAHVVGDSVKVQACYREWGPRRRVNAEGLEQLFYEAPKTFIFNTCVNLIAELPGIRWAGSKNPLVNDPEKLVDKDNHAFDALCYGLLYHREGPPDATKKNAGFHHWSPKQLANPAQTHSQHIVQQEQERLDASTGRSDDDADDSDLWGLD